MRVLTTQSGFMASTMSTPACVAHSKFSWYCNLRAAAVVVVVVVVVEVVVVAVVVVVESRLLSSSFTMPALKCS